MDFGSARDDVTDGKQWAVDAARDVDVAVWEARATVLKFDGDDAFVPGATPVEVVESGPNMLLTAGVNQLWQIVTGQGGVLFSAANAYVAVGDSTSTATASQTDLQASTNKLRKQVSAAPTISNNVVTFSASYGTSDANFAWNEFGVANASSGGTLLNRFVSGLGTKSNSASWTINIAVTIS